MRGNPAPGDRSEGVADLVAVGADDHRSLPRSWHRPGRASGLPRAQGPPEKKSGSACRRFGPVQLVFLGGGVERGARPWRSDLSIECQRNPRSDPFVELPGPAVDSATLDLLAEGAVPFQPPNHVLEGRKAAGFFFFFFSFFSQSSLLIFSLFCSGRQGPAIDRRHQDQTRDHASLAGHSASRSIGHPFGSCIMYKVDHRERKRT